MARFMLGAIVSTANRVIMLTASLVAPQVVVTNTCGAACDDNICIMPTSCVHDDSDDRIRLVNAMGMCFSALYTSWQDLRGRRAFHGLDWQRVSGPGQVAYRDFLAETSSARPSKGPGFNKPFVVGFVYECDQGFLECFHLLLLSKYVFPAFFFSHTLIDGYLGQRVHTESAMDVFVTSVYRIVVFSASQYRRFIAQNVNYIHQIGRGNTNKNINVSCYWSFIRGLRRWRMDSPHKGPVMRKSFFTPWRHNVVTANLGVVNVRERHTPDSKVLIRWSLLSWM